MKKFTLKNSYLLIAAFVSIVLLASCSNDDDNNPEYAGTWVTTFTSTEDGNSIQIKDVMTLTQSGFSDLYQVYNPTTSKYTDYIKLSGSLAVSGSTMTVKATEIGVSSFDLTTGYPTGTITSYKEGSSQFESLFTLTGQAKTFKSEYSISGNKLTLKTDNNNDGDYTDANETTVYTRE